MTDRTQGSIEIQAAPARVMTVIADYGAYPEWVQGMKAVRVLETDARGRGRRVAFHVSTAGIEARYTLTYSYAPRSSGVSWTSTDASGAVKGVEGEYELQPTAGGTMVSYRLSLDLAISLPGFLRRQAEKTIVTSALANLKTRVESG
ncbi:MAG: SRPBCC family protein [Actinobacteria bacterium]|nr:SRPBCC family protein [Actinomycetota bacterium]